jgi:hypothetical protein
MDRASYTRSRAEARAFERRQNHALVLESAAFRVALHWMTGEVLEWEPPSETFRPRSLHRKTERRRGLKLPT